MTAPLTPDQQTASAIIQQQLSAWGLDSLAGDLNSLIRQGLQADAITLKLQQTAAYQQRFAANATRVKNGLAALSPADYINAENAYAQVMRQYGLPSGFYDQQSDFADFIAKDVSPSELNDRVKVAQQVFVTGDPVTRSVFRDWYGLSDGAGIAAILDPNKALPILQNMATAAQAGGVARQNGLDADQQRITGYVDQGISLADLTKGFQDIGAAHPTDQAIAQRFGQTFDQAQEEQATIQNLASAKRKQQQLYSSEQALFASRSGADATSLNARTGGAF